MSDEHDSPSQDGVGTESIAVKIVGLPQNELLRIGHFAESLVGRSRSREFIAEAAKSCLTEKHPWDPSVDLAHHLIDVMAAMRARELEGRTPGILAKLEREVSGDNLVSKVLSALRRGLSEGEIEEYYEMSPNEYRAALDKLQERLQTLAGEKESPTQGQDPATYAEDVRKQLLGGVALSKRLARIAATAARVWGDQKAAQRFLTTSHPMLDGKAPIDAATTEDGARRVEQILTSLVHGLPV